MGTRLRNYVSRFFCKESRCFSGGRGGGVFEHLAPNVFAPSRHLQVQLGFICTNRVAVTFIQRLLKLIISLLGLCLGFRLRVLVLVRVTVRLEKCYG